MNDSVMITLYDAENNEPISYRLERIFSVDETGKLYCAVAPEKGEGTIFLRCDVSRDDILTVEDIQEEAEYQYVETYYSTYYMEENEQEKQDFITVMDDGEEKTFLVHAVFEDEKKERIYIALQEIKNKDIVSETISLYRLWTAESGMSIESIPSDMEYEMAKKMFEKIIKNKENA